MALVKIDKNIVIYAVVLYNGSSIVYYIRVLLLFPRNNTVMPRITAPLE